MGITLIIGLKELTTLNAMTLIQRTVVHDKAIAYPTPYLGDLSLEEELTYVNPTIKLMGIVCVLFALRPS